MTAPLLPRRSPPREPIFIVGSPRSGTTLLFQILDASPHLASLGAEGHLLWDTYHRMSSGEGRSHALTADDVSDGERRALYWAIEKLAGQLRFLDKTPRNALRIPYLNRLFPDAHFVFLKRDGRAAVSSLITAWRDGDDRFTTANVETDIDGYGGRGWRFLLPPGWQAFQHGHTLADVCAFQWVSSNEAILQAKGTIAAERWTEVAYEDLVATPTETIDRLLSAIRLPASAEVMAAAEATASTTTATAVTSPEPEKWKRENPDEVASILPAILPMMRRLGYSVE